MSPFACRIPCQEPGFSYAHALFGGTKYIPFGLIQPFSKAHPMNHIQLPCSSRGISEMPFHGISQKRRIPSPPQHNVPRQTTLRNLPITSLIKASRSTNADIDNTGPTRNPPIKPRDNKPPYIFGPSHALIQPQPAPLNPIRARITDARP